MDPRDKTFEPDAVMRRCESCLRRLLERAGQVVWMDRAAGGRGIYASASFKDLWGLDYSPEEPGGHLCLDRIHPYDRAAVETAYRQLADEGQFTVEFRIVRPDGTTRWARDRGWRVPDGGDADADVTVGVTEDITERKEAELEALHLQNQLLHAQKLESLGVMAGGIAHDFNNLLVAILGNAEMALQELPAHTPAHAFVNEVRLASLRAADLANQMLAYSGKGRLAVQPVDVNAIVAEMAHLLKAAIPRRITLGYELTRPMPKVAADAVQLRQVLMNMITNASEAIGDRHGEIRIRTGLVDASRGYLAGARLGETLTEGTYVYLEVADTGAGMDQATQDRLFEPFFTTKFTGRGLGMSAALGIMRSHKGAIFVDSTPGRGTTIRLLFPPCEPAETARVEPAPAAARQADWRGSGLVLVIDDEHAVRNMARLMLERLGFTVLTARNGAEGIVAFCDHDRETVAILLDLTMPIMDGEETLAELVRIREDIPIILCSGYAAEDAVRRFAGKPIAEFLHKPFSLDDLAAVLRRQLEGRTAGAHG